MASLPRTNALPSNAWQQQHTEPPAFQLYRDTVRAALLRALLKSTALQYLIPALSTAKWRTSITCQEDRFGKRLSANR